MDLQVKAVGLVVAEQQGEGGEVGGGGQVKAAPAGQAAQHLVGRERVGAAHEDVVRDPRGLRRGPYVQVQPEERVEIAGYVLGFLHFLLEVLLAADAAVARVCLLPSRLLRPVVVGVGAVQHRQKRLVHQRTGLHLPGVLVHLPADAVAVVARGGEGDDERLGPRSGRRDQYVPQVAVGLGVELVEDDRVAIEPVLGGRLGAYGLVKTRLVLHRVAQHLAPLAQLGVVVDHLLGDAEDDVGLLPVPSSRDNLGTWLTVAEQHVQCNRRREVRLAVLPRYLDVAGAVLAPAVGTLPPK